MNYIEEITAIEAMVGETLADASEITPQEIRECFAAVVSFLKKTSPLASGSYPVGDANGTDTIRTIDLPYNVGMSNYYVVGSLVSLSADFNKDNDVFEMVKDKTPTSFKLCLREVAGMTQSLTYDWAIYPKN